MRVVIDHNILSVVRRHTTRNGTCYDEVTDLGVIREPMPQYGCPNWTVYFYRGPNVGVEIVVASKDAAIHMLLETVTP